MAVAKLSQWLLSAGTGEVTFSVPSDAVPIVSAVAIGGQVAIGFMVDGTEPLMSRHFLAVGEMPADDKLSGMPVLIGTATIVRVNASSPAQQSWGPPLVTPMVNYADGRSPQNMRFEITVPPLPIPVVNLLNGGMVFVFEIRPKPANK